MTRTQVAIIGAGPAGLTLARLLQLRGIDSVVLEIRDRAHIEKRLRAGVLEHATVELLRAAGVGERLDREGLTHSGVKLRFDRRTHRIDFEALTGRTITVYGQQEVVKDLVAARMAADQPLIFQVSDVRLSDVDTERPQVRYRVDDREEVLDCDYIAGCDGFHGVSRASVPSSLLTGYEREYPFAWLGILAEAAPSSEELVYANHERGFALHSMRSPTVTRQYLQVPVDESLAGWSDDRIWSELQLRLADDDGFELTEGPIIDRGITPMRSFVVDPMQYGRLFLVGDSAHIVPPTGAKGMNLAIADASVLAGGLAAVYDGRGDRALRDYSATCLRRVWRVQHFSWWMTQLLHRFADDDGYGRQLQHSQLAYVASSAAAAMTLAENYVGLPFESGR